MSNDVASGAGLLSFSIRSRSSPRVEALRILADPLRGQTHPPRAALHWLSDFIHFLATCALLCSGGSASFYDVRGHQFGPR